MYKKTVWTENVKVIPKKLTAQSLGHQHLTQIGLVHGLSGVQDSEICINLTSSPTLILVETKASPYQSWSEFDVNPTKNHCGYPSIFES